ncbi:MAG: hypothetical protein CMM01_24790 [Rhodopirellula sp.]|nr:hypothetical protein [Rhodopirellula sp.]
MKLNRLPECCHVPCKRRLKGGEVAGDRTLVERPGPADFFAPHNRDPQGKCLYMSARNLGRHPAQRCELLIPNAYSHCVA